jgi:hypothetical protein
MQPMPDAMLVRGDAAAGAQNRTPEWAHLGVNGPVIRAAVGER